MGKGPVYRWFTVMVITAFVSVISFFNINSYFADKHKINWLFTVVGIIFALVAIYSYAKANQYGNPGKPK